MSKPVNRRFFVKLSFFGLAAASLANLLTSRFVQARSSGRPQDSLEVPKVDMKDAQAKALLYVENATESPFRKSDVQFCHNCNLYSGQDGAQWGPCAIFSYRVNEKNQQLVVNANGWCRSWGARAT